MKFKSLRWSIYLSYALLLAIIQCETGENGDHGHGAPLHVNQSCDTPSPSYPHDRKKRSSRPLDLEHERGNDEKFDKNLRLKNATCANDSLSCARRSCPNNFSSVDKSTCYCDRYCGFFQDCCYDYSNACNETKRNRSDLFEEDFPTSLTWSCVQIGMRHYWMKNNCSNSWRNTQVLLRCINAPSMLNSSTYMDYIPVLGKDNITYRNQYCAECNYQTPFEFWMLNISLGFELVGVQNIGDLIDLALEFNIGENVVPKIHMPRRYCPKLVSTCHYNLASEKVGACTNGEVELVLAGRKVYLNRHCAFCNGKNNVTCGKAGYSEAVDTRLASDFYLTVNFKHKSRSSGFSFNHACPSKAYDHHLKACLHPDDIVSPVDTPLDRYRVAVWFISKSSCTKLADFQKFLTDVEPSNIFNPKIESIRNSLRMYKFDVQLSLNQSLELLEDYSEITEKDSASAYSIFKFLLPFTRPFAVQLGMRTVKVIKTSSRRLGCVGLQVYNASDYMDIGSGKIHVFKTKRNYTRDQYFEDNTLDGLVKVCKIQLPTDCDGFRIEYRRSDFDLRTNLTFYHKLTGKLYPFGRYSLNNDTVYICHKVLKSKNNVVRQYLTFVGLCLSISCLVIVFVTYVTFSQLRSTAPGKNMINLTVWLVLFYVIWLVGPQAVQNRSACIATAFGVQYFMLLSYVSMAKIAHDTMCMFTDPIAHQRGGSACKLNIFILSWLIPLVYVALCFALYHFNVLEITYTKICWLSGGHAYIIFYVPVGLTMAFSILCFTRSIQKMRTLERNGQMLRAQKQERSSMSIYIKISTLLGLGWATSIVAVPFEELSYVFVVLTTFQGFYIFLAFICKKNVLLLYRNLLWGSAKGPASSRNDTKASSL